MPEVSSMCFKQIHCLCLYLGTVTKFSVSFSNLSLSLSRYLCNFVLYCSVPLHFLHFLLEAILKWFCKIVNHQPHIPQTLIFILLLFCINMYHLINICIIYYKSIVHVLNKSVQIKENMKGTLRRKDDCEGSLINIIKCLCQ